MRMLLLLILVLLLGACQNTGGKYKPAPDYTKVEKYNRPLMEGSNLIIVNRKLSKYEPGLDRYTLSDGSEDYVAYVDLRVKFLSKYVHPKNRDKAYQHLKPISIKYDKIDNLWSLTHKDYKDSALTTNISIRDKIAILGMSIKYMNSNWVFFNKITIVSGDTRYNRSFPEGKVSRNAYESGIQETVWFPIEDEEIDIVNALRKTPGIIRFRGKFTDDKKIKSYDVKTINSVLALNELIDVNFSK